MNMHTRMIYHSVSSVHGVSPCRASHLFFSFSISVHFFSMDDIIIITDFGGRQPHAAGAWTHRARHRKMLHNTTSCINKGYQVY